ncbi:MAG: hypothetical protein E7477_02865 [Ruminococcaceae bacterium]|nr:hypothetical protein [Oscillospiraceae bacterium]
MFKFFQKSRIAYFIMSVLLFAVGLCLIIWPSFITKVICYIIGSIALIAGIIELVIFFVRDISVKTVSYSLIIGFLSSIFGLILLLKPDNSAVFFSMLFGVFIIIDSVLKLQTSFELRNLGVLRWWVNLILALASAVLGVLLVINPFATTNILFIFMGISLVVDALENIWTVIFISIASKQMKKMAEEDAILIVEE